VNVYQSSCVGEEAERNGRVETGVMTPAPPQHFLTLAALEEHDARVVGYRRHGRHVACDLHRGFRLQLDEGQARRVRQRDR
jgi:hypothetical protein